MKIDYRLSLEIKVLMRAMNGICLISVLQMKRKRSSKRSIRGIQIWKLSIRWDENLLSFKGILWLRIKSFQKSSHCLINSEVKLGHKNELQDLQYFGKSLPLHLQENHKLSNLRWIKERKWKKRSETSKDFTELV